MQKNLFRQQSIDQISSPEQVRDYLRATSPKIWMIIAAVAALALGFVAYISTAEQEETVPVQVTVENFADGELNYATITFEIPAEDRDRYQIGMEVRFAGTKGKIRYFVDGGRRTFGSVDVPEGTEIPDGTYEAEVVVGTSTPIGELLQ